jgi:hypothetical protein
MRRTVWLGVGIIVLAATAACGSNSGDDGADEFRESVPQAADVATGLPGERGSGTTAKSVAGSLHALDLPKPDAPAQFYVMTRDVADLVDVATAEVLGLVWLLAHSPPTTLAADQATWGPVDGDALSPVNWRFVVKKVGPGEYNFEFDGRPKGSTNDADFKAILTGHGYDHTSQAYRSGNFTLDRSAAKALDPARNTDTGPLVITFDLRAAPATIHLTATPDAPAVAADAVVTRDADGGGSVSLTTKGDVDANNGKGILEDVLIKSRWIASGAGRGDAKISGGDLTSTYTGTQCWGTSFTATYATDTADNVTVGDASSCVVGPQL